MRQASIWSFLIAPQPMELKPVTINKLSVKTVSPQGTVITLDELKEWDSDRNNLPSEIK